MFGEPAAPGASPVEGLSLASGPTTSHEIQPRLHQPEYGTLDEVEMSDKIDMKCIYLIYYGTMINKGIGCQER